MKKKAILFALVIALMLSIIVPAYAAVLPYTMTYYPGTADTVTNLPDADGGTGGEAYTVSSTIPQRAGYEFIDWTLDYGVGYIVTYVVNPDKTYGSPADSKVPIDPKKYAPGELVDVEDDLTTTKDYAYNEKGEMVTGTWEFVTWDKSDFEIDADTTITGGWVFTPAPAKTYHYTVYYKLYEGDPYGGTEVHKSTSGDVLPFTEVHIDAEPVNKLYGPYRNKTQIYPGFQHVDVTIKYDNFEITIWYLPKSHGQVVNPNTVLLTYDVYGDPNYGLPDDVNVPDKKAYTKNKDRVTIAEALCTARDYAMLNGETVPGTWTFTGWDKTGAFVINADTTVTGSWIFMPAEEPEPEERASCTVRYLDQDGTPLAPEITYTGRRAGMQIQAEARQFDGCNLLSDPFITITLEPGDNVITFCYEKIVEEKASFTMRYLLKDGTPIADEKTVTGQTAGREMTAKAKTITGYRLISDEVITIELQAGDNNIFTFFYEKEEPVKEEIPEDVPEDVIKDAREGVTEDAPEGVTEDVPEDAPKDVPEDAPKDVPEDAPKDVPEDAPKDVPEDAPKDVPEDAPKDVPEGATEDAPKDAPTDSPAPASEPAPLNTEPHIVLLTYEVYGNQVYGLPDDVTLPDKKAYSRGDTVEVAEALITAQDYAMLDGEQVLGTWTFTGWDKTEAFVISANTTITGGWSFTPDTENEPETKPEEETETEPEEETEAEPEEEIYAEPEDKPKAKLIDEPKAKLIDEPKAKLIDEPKAKPKDEPEAEAEKTAPENEPDTEKP